MTIFFVALFSASSAFAQTPDVYKTIFNTVDKSNINLQLRNMSGANIVTVGGQSFRILERQSEPSKQLYRLYWKNYFKNLGLEVNDQSFKNHNMEVVLPGHSPDSLVIIVHYDSGGVISNAGADDDMLGMSVLMEAARILSQYQGRLEHTIRFAAIDYEEKGGFVGAKEYAQYIQKLSSQNHFKVFAAIDYEQSGWAGGGDLHRFALFGCGLQGPYANLLIGMAQTASEYGKMTATINGCQATSDYISMAEIGVPSMKINEYDHWSNPYRDRNGDTVDTVNIDYLYHIAQIEITYTALLLGIDAP